jgi:hypothetical protein
MLIHRSLLKDKQEGKTFTLANPLYFSQLRISRYCYKNQQSITDRRVTGDRQVHCSLELKALAFSLSDSLSSAELKSAIVTRRVCYLHDEAISATFLLIACPEPISVKRG